MISFDKFLECESKKQYYNDLMEKLDYEYKHYTIYPSRELVFNALKLCPLENVKVVIIGQDPYINEGQAHGLAFSVENEIITPSLRNIYKELKNDLGIKRSSTNLSDWALQGVLLINTILTVREKKSLTHKGIGWEEMCKNLIMYIEENMEDCVYILWGKTAQDYEKYIHSKYIIKSVHPSPLSSYRGFFGSKPFSKCNKYLSDLNKITINW